MSLLERLGMGQLCAQTGKIQVQSEISGTKLYHYLAALVKARIPRFQRKRPRFYKRGYDSGGTAGVGGSFSRSAA